MSSSVSIAIGTNTAIAISKGIGWFLTGSPTLFAETVHSLADVGNQVLLKIGEVRGREGPDDEHPFGHGQEKYFWALVSAVSVFFIGCGINLYHGIHADSCCSPSRSNRGRSSSRCASLAASRASARTATTRPCLPCCSKTPSHSSASC